MNLNIYCGKTKNLHGRYPNICSQKVQTRFDEGFTFLLCSQKLLSGENKFNLSQFENQINQRTEDFVLLNVLCFGTKINVSQKHNTALRTQQVLSTRCSMKKSLDSSEDVSFLYCSRLSVHCAMLMLLRLGNDEASYTTN